MSQHLQKIILPIRGMHCRSCEILLEEKFSAVQYVKKSAVHHRQGVAEIYFDKEKPAAKDLETAVVSAGYEVGETEKPGFFSRNPRDYQELFWAIITVLVSYFVLKFFGVIDLNFNTNPAANGLATALVVGLVAGFSSCMALIGGLVLGLSAKHAEKHPEATATQKFRPHIFFNLGRIGGYILLGGLLGALGSIFQLSTGALGFMTFLVAAVMLFVGLQLIEIFPRLNRWKLTLPKGLAKIFGRQRHHAEYSHKNAIIAGALTFFLPCGFTQAMQIYAVSTGSFISGALTMGLFALGTAPGLLSIGGLTSALKGAAARKFFKIAGVVVIMFALFNFSNGLTLAGVNLNRNGNGATANTEVKDPNVTLVDGVQVVKMKEKSNGYSPNKFTIQKGVPVRWEIDATAPYSCASSLVVPKLNIRKNLVPGKNIIEFTAKETGKIPFSCSMGMYTGSFNVVDENGKTSAAAENSSATNSRTLISGSTCGGPGGGCGGCGGGRQFNQAAAPAAESAATANGVQLIKSTFTVNSDIEPNTFAVKAGEPVEYDIDVREDGAGCMYAIMIPELYNEPVVLEAGKKIVMRFTPQEKGDYPITCGMGMIRGLIKVQ